MSNAAKSNPASAPSYGAASQTAPSTIHHPSSALSALPALLALRVSNGALAAKDLPPRLKILAWGKNQSTQGEVLLDDLSAKLLPLNQRALGFERVALDYEHNTVPGSPEYERTNEPREIGGQGAVEIVPGDGLYLTAMAWTPSGEKSARNYEDLSPAVGLDKERRVIFVHSTALARNGAVFDLSFFSAAAPKIDKVSDKVSDKDMNPTIETLSATVTALSARLEQLATSNLSASAQSSGATTDLLTRLSALEARLDGAERDALIGGAAREGKVIPLSAEEILTVPVATLRAMISKLPGGLVPFSARAGRVQENASAPNKGALLASAVEKYQADHKCNFDTAFNRVRAAEPTLFS